MANDSTPSKSPYEWPLDRSALESLIEITERDIYENAKQPFFDPRFESQHQLLEQIAHNTNVERLTSLLFCLKRELEKRKHEEARERIVAQRRIARDRLDGVASIQGDDNA